MISTKNVANAVGGKTARACDNCIRKRARWYCTADDAFLCQSCDSSVHSANSLARRHHRVRLKTASFKPTSGELLPSSDNSGPSWHRGFTRKARTPRNGKQAIHQLEKSDKKSRHLFPLVPAVGGDETSHEENEEEHLLFRVPIFDPFVSEFCTSSTSNEAAGNETGFESKAVLLASHSHDIDSLHGFLPSDMDPAEFAADVESLLGRGLENECFGMEELGLMGSNENDCNSFGSERIKLEKEETCEAHGGDTEIDMMRDQFELNFDDYDTPPSCAEEEDKVNLGVENGGYDDNSRSSERKTKKRKALLSLNCEAVISAWGSHGSPWSNGKRPDFEPDDCWPHCMGSREIQKHHHPYGELMGGGTGGQAGGNGDGGREARVSRYREKRRTRLFSKKIRYEVRKLNAEKRPRMKGRFVKRSSFGASPGFQMISNK